ncbi:hypothetical protein HYQ56_1163 [Lactobacillus crispatus]|uniref:Uncharacterized protein n=1 Tax=Lactobacillus crispatus TaxID=47770 RepID=A0AAW4DP28_9LACO|nr:hypothetical protein [Lactobacillus crispatus]
MFLDLSLCIYGITSTYVENTLALKFMARHHQDHLHIRGEYLKRLSKLERSTGSPPHTWRILHRINGFFDCTRITSTYVENTPFIEIAETRNKDHLHIRGEYPFLSSPSKMIGGSPPHTWRILKLLTLFIQFFKDHLHIRGEYKKRQIQLAKT